MIKNYNPHSLSYMHQKQVVRLLAMAMADDGSVGKVEFDEVCAIVRELQIGDIGKMGEITQRLHDIAHEYHQQNKL